MDERAKRLEGLTKGFEHVDEYGTRPAVTSGASCASLATLTVPSDCYPHRLIERTACGHYVSAAP
jgi:hypothetical protein